MVSSESRIYVIFQVAIKPLNNIGHAISDCVWVSDIRVVMPYLASDSEWYA
jgi:hypothetical protein